MKKTYQFDVRNLCQKTQYQETMINTLQAELVRVRARNLKLESELSSQQNEASNWKNKCQTLDDQLNSQAELIAVKEARKLDLGLKIT